MRTRLSRCGAPRLASAAYPGSNDDVEPYRTPAPAVHLLLRENALVRESVRGRSIAKAIADGVRFDEPAAKRLAADVLRLLVHLHASAPNAVHRGITPDTVILRDDAPGVALVDFEGQRPPGADAYVAPEQFRGTATPASDVYALGTTLVFLLAGRPPSEMPQKKLAVDFRPFFPTSPAFGAWLDRMIAPAPEDRFRSAGDALASLLRGDAARTRAAAKARTRLFVLLALLGVVVVGASGFALREIRAARLEETSRAMGRGGALTPLPARPILGGMSVSNVRVIPAHFSAVMDLAYSADGATLATASYDGTAKLWNAATGAPLRSLAGHKGRVGSVAFTSKGDTVVTAGDTTVRVWRTSDGAPLRTITASSSPVTRAVVTPDDKTIVSVGYDGVAKTWDLATGAPKLTLPHAPGKTRLIAVAVSPDGTRAYTGGDDAVVKVWDLANGALVRALVGHAGPVNRITPAPDGQTLLTADDDRTVRAWNVLSGRPIQTWRDHTDEAWAVDVSPDGSTIVSGGKDDRIVLAELMTGHVRAQVSDDEKTLAIAFAPDGKTFASAHGNGAVRVWAPEGRGRGTHLAEPRPEHAKPEPAPATPEEKLYVEARASLDGWSGESLGDVEAKLNDALAKNPRFALAYVGLARVAMDRGYRSGSDWAPESLKAAAALLDRADAISPHLVDTLVQRARVARAQKDPATAQRAADAAAAIAPDDPAVLVERAELASDRHDYAEADRAASDAIERMPPSRPGLLRRAYAELEDVYAASGDVDACEKAYEKEISLDPTSAWPRGDYASFLERHGEHDRAIEMAKSALAQMDYGVGHHVLARAYAGQGTELLWDRSKPVEAKAAFDQALLENPKDVTALYGRGAYYRWAAMTQKNRQLADESKAAFERAVAADPTFDLAKQALAEHPRVVAALDAK